MVDMEVFSGTHRSKKNLDNYQFTENDARVNVMYEGDFNEKSA